jgi:hypothetical protein
VWGLECLFVLPFSNHGCMCMSHHPQLYMSRRLQGMPVGRSKGKSRSRAGFGGGRVRKGGSKSGVSSASLRGSMPDRPEPPPPKVGRKEFCSHSLDQQGA